MPTEKIGEIPKEAICTDREHSPPQHQVFKPGIYKHTCPTCGQVRVFTVQPVTW